MAHRSGDDDRTRIYLGEAGMTVFTYTVNIPSNSIMMTDAAINLFLHNNPAASVEDALDALFGLGVDTFIARCTANGKPETGNEVLSSIAQNNLSDMSDMSDMAYGEVCL